MNGTRRSRPALQLALVLCLAACLAACGTFWRPWKVEPGTSTAEDVVTYMGQPEEKLAEASGDTVWFYPSRLIGRETWAFRIAPDGRVSSVEQRLTEANAHKVVAGKTTIAEVRALLGPPTAIHWYPLKKVHSWNYAMITGNMDNWMVLWVEHGDDGVVSSAIYTLSLIHI